MPPPPSHAGRAFTLIELMIAISLGMVLVLTAVSAVRVTTQAITLTRRIALENALLRTGVEQALDEVDFWRRSDDPEDTSRQPLRGTEASGGWLPFTPFAATPDAVTHGSFIDAQPGLTELAGTPRGGWNANPLAWAAWDPRAWPRGCPAEESSPQESWGAGGIYANLDPALSWHHWYDGQVRGLVDALGFYGLYDYLPSNAFMVYHGASAPLGAPGGICWSGVPTSLLSNGVWIDTNDGGDNNMKGRVRNTNGSRVFFPGPDAVAANTARTWAPIGYNGRDNNYDASVMALFLAKSATGAHLLGARPALWPDVGYVVRRFVERGQLRNACEVTCRSPVTGAALTIPFACIGTTLRGARQQRLPGGGWVADAASAATLDYGTPP